MTIDCDWHQKSFEKVGESLQFVSLVNSSRTSHNYSLENTTTYTDNISVKSDSIITQTLLHEKQISSSIVIGFGSITLRVMCSCVDVCWWIIGSSFVFIM